MASPDQPWAISTSDVEMPTPVAGGDTMFHQSHGWEWEGAMVSPDQPWAISVSDVETPTPAHTVVSTSTSSKPVDAEGGGKRARDGDTDAPTPGVSSVTPLKKVKPKTTKRRSSKAWRAS